MSKVRTYRDILYITTCLSSICLSNIVNALPENPDVQAGNVSFNQAGNELHITQQTEKAIINWKGFDINHGELTQFHQPSSSSIALNRVISQNPTKIDGALKANGNIIIINQNGVLFGKGAVVDVNRLMVSTIDTDNDKFMNSATKLEFNKPGSIDAQIINEGNITANDAGLVGFVAPQVINNGIIVANGGTVTLASGETFTLDMYGDKIIEVAVSDNLKKQLIKNKGLIQADGGKIILTAAAGKEIIDSLIQVEGELKSVSVAEKNGEIIIFAEGSNAVKDNIAENKNIRTGESRIEINGTVNASGMNPEEKGGKILIAADDITLKNRSLVIASGYNGKANITKGKEKSAPRDGSAGGEILIGGNYLGKGSTPTAKNLTMENYAVIVNDSLNSGDAGRTILWSDNETKFNGFILSRSFGGKKAKANSLDPETGGNAGDGGFVETSGHKNLESTGFTILTASNGERGTHLLDPENITIYGKFSPDYESTDSSINLASKLKIHLDASSESSVTLLYINSAQTATSNDSGTINVDDGSSFQVGMQIRLSSSSLIDKADVFNDDTHTILAVSGNELVIDPATNFSGSMPVYVAYVSSWADSAGMPENASNNDSTKMPLWLVNTLNGDPVVNFDGTSDNLNANLSFMNDGTFGYNGQAHTNFYTAKTTTYGRLYSTATRNGDTYEGFKTSGDAIEYTMDYTYGGDYLSSFVTSGSINPSSAFTPDFFNILTYQWLPDSGSDRTNRRTVYTNTNLELTASPAGTIGPYGYPSTIGGKSGYYWGGQMAEIMMYNANLDSNTINLLNQYSSAKWDLTLVPPGESGLGSTEALKAMASVFRGTDGIDGYSSFTTDYLKRLSRSADIYLTAGTDITLDLKGDTLTLNDNANFVLTAGGDIISSSTGTIKTKRTASGGNIDIAAEGSLDLSKISMNAQDGGTITLVAGRDHTLSFNPNTFSNSIVSMTVGVAGAAQTVSISGITANNKIYDSTTSGTFSGTIAASNASITGTPVATFANKNVGTSKPITLNGISLSLSGDNLYHYTAPTYTANITPSTLSLSGLSADKTYDTTTVAPITGTATITPFSGDSVSVIGTPIGSFADKNVSLSKPVTVTGLSLTGDDASNYQLDSTFSADIYKKLLDISGLNADKTYDATTTATISGTLVIEPFSGDSVTAPEVTHGVFFNKDVGTNKNVFIGFLELGGTDAANYQLSAIFLSNITPATLSVSGLSASNKVYDTTISATISGTASINPLSGDIVSISGTPIGSFVDKNVGTSKAVFLTGLSLAGTDASNYQIDYGFPTANITPSTLSVSGLSANKTYDASTIAFIAGTPFVNPLGSDSVGVIGTPLGSFADKNISLSKVVTVTGLSLSGTDASNYHLDSNFLANITPAPLYVTANNIKVVYPTSTAPLTYTYYGLVGGETSANFQGNLTRSSGNNVGSYSITEGDLTVVENYEIGSFTSGTFNISAPSSADLVAIIPSSSNLLSSFTASIVNISNYGNESLLPGPLGILDNSMAPESRTDSPHILAPSSKSTPASMDLLIDMNAILSKKIASKINDIDPA